MDPLVYNVTFYKIFNEIIDTYPSHTHTPPIVTTPHTVPNKLYPPP